MTHEICHISSLKFGHSSVKTAVFCQANLMPIGNYPDVQLPAFGRHLVTWKNYVSFYFVAFVHFYSLLFGRENRSQLLLTNRLLFTWHGTLLDLYFLTFKNVAV